MTGAKLQQKPGKRRSPETAPAAANVPWLSICVQVVLTRVVIAVIGAWSHMIILKDRFDAAGAKSLLDYFFRWDSGWYLAIIQNGYTYTPGQQSSIAFFPLYPMLVKVLSLGGIFDMRVVGFLLSNVALAYGCGCLWRLTQRYFGSRETADSAVMLALVAPVGFFMSIFYTEGLFFCCMAACMDFAERERWWMAGVWGFAASLTRSTGVVLSPFLVLAMIAFVKSPPFVRIRTRWPNWPVVILPALGLLCYFLFLQIRFGSYTVFMDTQHAWGRELVYPWTPFQPTFGHNNAIPQSFRYLFKGSIVAVGIVAAIGVLARVPLSWLSVIVSVPIFSLMSSALDSMPRYLVVIVPYYAVLAYTIERWRFLKVPVIMFSCMLAAFSVILFVNGYWFT